MDMKLDTLKTICKNGGYYRTPELNEVLYFHYKGFHKIDEIDAYCNARCVWLEGNAIEKIENLETLTQLRQLYLQENLIRKIEGLDKLTSLVSVNLACNFITRVEGLSTLTNLKTLNLKQNRLRSVEDIVHLLQCPSLETVNLNDNKIDDPDCVEEVFVKMPSLLTLYAHQNPFCQHVKPYRKTIVGKIAALKYLDDRPVFPDERRATDAWMRGGVEAEKAEREAIRREEVERNERNRLAFRELINQAKREKAEMDARGEAVPNTEFHDMNYTKRTAEDEWYTAERARNAAKRDEVRRMEKEMLLHQLCGQKDSPPAPDAADATPPMPRHVDPAALMGAAQQDDAAQEGTVGDPEAEASPDLAAPDTGDKAEAEGSEGGMEDITSQVLLDYKEILQGAPADLGAEEVVYASEQSEQWVGGCGNDPSGSIDAELKSAGVVQAAGPPPSLQRRTVTQPADPARPMVWGTPAYDALWKQAVAAGEDLEAAEAAASAPVDMKRLTDELSACSDSDERAAPEAEAEEEQQAPASPAPTPTPAPAAEPSATADDAAAPPQQPKWAVPAAASGEGDT